MFGFAIGLHDVRERFRRVFNAQWRAWAGAAFVALALASIEYDEVVAPGMNRLSGAWSNVAADFGRRFSSLAL